MSFAVPFLAAVVTLGTEGPVNDLPGSAREFIADHCISCHDKTTKKGGLDLSSLRFDANDRALFTRWVALHDRVRDGEMPPKDADKLEPQERSAFLSAIGDQLAVRDRERARVSGRSVWRRLNRYEYENTLRELLEVPWLQIRDRLPEDGEAYRFNKSGEALDVSHVQLARYLGAAEYALREATASRVDKPESKVVRYYAREQRSFINKMKFGPFNRSPERATFPLLDNQAQPEVIEEKAPVSVGRSNPEIREREAFGVVASSYEPMEPTFNSFRAPISGRYKLKFSAYSFWAGPGKGPRWWTPDRNVASAGRTVEPVVISSEVPPRQRRQLGRFDVKPEPGVYEIEASLLKGETIAVDAARLFRSRPPAWHNPLATTEGSPGVAFRWMEVEGPIFDEWPPTSHKILFGDLPLKAGKDSITAAVSKSPLRDAERLMQAFLARAYRRPVATGEVQRFLPVVKSALESGADFNEAMYAGFSGVLCSPEFVCLVEAPGRLDDHSLASRLSYFLWNSPPDEALRSLADRSGLNDSTALRKQVDRLLDDPKSQRFVDAFLDYWLDLRRIQASSADELLYPDYYLDDLLVDSALEETRLFFAELLRADLPSRNIVAADFAFINDRLADHYGLPKVGGSALKKVTLPSSSSRGGLLTQASVLKVTANGTTTSPVVRGAWVMERIVGKPPSPPPPGIPAVEPDIRGAATIRDQLDKHRSIKSCASCHAKIDPPGFALEAFDILGGARDHYRAISEKNCVAGFGKNGQPFKFAVPLEVDPSGTLADGRKFADVREMKRLLLTDERQIARNMLNQLLIYATGTPIRFGDRAEAEKILDATAANGYRVRSLIHALVQSDLFRSK